MGPHSRAGVRSLLTTKTMRGLHLSIWKTLSAWSVALALASSTHAALVWGVMHFAQGDEKPPRPLSGFEIVELPASMAAAEPKAEPELEPEAELEPEPEPEPENTEPVVESKPKSEPKPIMIPVAKLKIKPKPKPKPEPKPVTVAKEKVKPKPKLEKKAPPLAINKPIFKGTQNLAATTAYVPPSRHAAYLKNPKPVYPTKARKRGMEGRVVLRVMVRRDGKVKSVKVETGSGFTLLDRAAKAAVLRWRFAPAKRSGMAVEGTVLVPFDFRLTSG